MLLNEFLFEAKSEKSQREEILIKNLADQIKKECKPFLKDNMSQILNGKYLCHSTELTSALRHDEEKFFHVIKLKKSRSPRDTDDEYHNAANAYFEKKFGVKFRSKSIFTFPNFANDSYGSPFIVFPVGEYKVCYSPKVYDAYNEIFDGSGKTGRNIIDLVKKTNIVDKYFGATKFGKFLMSYINNLSQNVRANVYQEMLGNIIVLEVFNRRFNADEIVNKILTMSFSAVIVMCKPHVKNEFRKRIGLQDDDVTTINGSSAFDDKMMRYFRESPEMKSDYEEFVKFVASNSKNKVVFNAFMDFLNYSTDYKGMFDKSRMEVMVHADSVILVKKSHYKKLLNYFKNE